MIVRANVNSIIDKHTDALKVLDVRILDAEKTLKNAMSAFDEMQLMRSNFMNDYREHLNSAKTWGEKAQQAVNSANDVEKKLAKKPNNITLQERHQHLTSLAKEALSHQIQEENLSSVAKEKADALDVYQAKKGVDKLSDHIERLRFHKRDFNNKMEIARIKERSALLNKDIDLDDKSSLLSEIERDVRQMHYNAEAQQELIDSSPERQLSLLEEEIELDKSKREIEERLSMLKGKDQIEN